MGWRRAWPVAPPWLGGVWLESNARARLARGLYTGSLAEGAPPPCEQAQRMLHVPECAHLTL